MPVIHLNESREDLHCWISSEPTGGSLELMVTHRHGPASSPSTTGLLIHPTTHPLKQWFSIGGGFTPTGDTWQRLETFLVVTTKEEDATGSE